MKNTALDMLKEEIFLEEYIFDKKELRSGYQNDYDFTEEYTEAKKLEKQQIINAFNAGLNTLYKDGEAYYENHFENEKEFIICSAIWYKDLSTQGLLPKNITKGIVVLGYRHMHGVGDYEQGFITNLNRFVDRYEAFDIAKNANQIINSNPIKRILFSEDLW